MSLRDRLTNIRKKISKDKTTLELEKINSLNGIVDYILSKMDEDAIKWIKGHERVEQFTAEAHFFLGRNIRNSLGLWQPESHLYNFFKDTYGLKHADDMSGIILKKLYNTVHGFKSDDWIETEIASYKTHWNKVNATDEYIVQVNGKYK